MSQGFTNNPTNVSQVGGTAIDTNSGVKSAGTTRVVLATDQPALTTPMPVDTEMAAAGPLVDATANPTTTLVGGCLHAFNGATWDRVRVANIRKDLATVTITTITTVWTPTSGKKFRIMGGMISVSAAGSVLFEDNAAGTTVFRTPVLLAATPYNFDLQNGILSAAANNVLKATLSVAGSITGTIWGVEE